MKHAWRCTSIELRQPYRRSVARGFGHVHDLSSVGRHVVIAKSCVGDRDAGQWLIDTALLDVHRAELERVRVDALANEVMNPAAIPRQPRPERESFRCDSTVAAP